MKIKSRQLAPRRISATGSLQHSCNFPAPDKRRERAIMSRAPAGECHSCRVKTVFHGFEKRLVLIDSQFWRICSASLGVGEGEAGHRSYFCRPGLRLLVSFITAASAFPWASQRNQLRPKPRSVLWNSRISTYPNELGASSPKWYVLIISDLQDKPLRTFSRCGNGLFRCRGRMHRSAAAKTLYDIAEVVRVLIYLFILNKSYLPQILWCQVLNVFQFPAEIGYVRLMKSALQRGGSFTDKSPFIRDEESSS